MPKAKYKKPTNYPKSIEGGFELIKRALLSDDKKLIDKAWKVLNEGKGDWVWVRAKLLTDCYGQADAKGREEFCHIGMERHVKEGNALPLAVLFVDKETRVEYQEFLMSDGTIYRIPIAISEMDKYVYQKALDKKFIGDFIETHSVDGIQYTLLDTQEKVVAYNNGTYYEKFKHDAL